MLRLLCGGCPRRSCPPDAHPCRRRNWPVRGAVHPRPPDVTDIRGSSRGPRPALCQAPAPPGQTAPRASGTHRGNRPETRKVTSIGAAGSSSAMGSTSIPDTRSDPCVPTPGARPARCSAMANSSPAVRIVAEPHRSTTSPLGPVAFLLQVPPHRVSSASVTPLRVGRARRHRCAGRWRTGLRPVGSTSARPR